MTAPADTKDPAKEAKKKSSSGAGGADAPPKYIRLTRGGVVWQNSSPWPSPQGAEPLPFRVGDIFREDDDTWIVFGLPDPKLTDARVLRELQDARGQAPPKGRALTRMGDVSELVVIAWLPTDPEALIVEAFTTADSARLMVHDLQVEALEDWLGTGDDDDDSGGKPPQLAERAAEGGAS